MATWLPAGRRTATIRSASSAGARVRAWTVEPARCGESETEGSTRSGWSRGSGSIPKASSTAPATRPSTSLRERAGDRGRRAFQWRLGSGSTCAGPFTGLHRRRARPQPRLGSSTRARRRAPRRQRRGGGRGVDPGVPGRDRCHRRCAVSRPGRRLDRRREPRTHRGRPGRDRHRDQRHRRGRGRGPDSPTEDAVNAGPIGIAALERSEGGFAMVALDQRESLRTLLSRDGMPASDDAMRSFKAEAAAALSPCASAVLLDRPFGLTGSVAPPLAPGSALVLAADRFVQPVGEPVRSSDVDPEVTVELVTASGATALKLLVVWREANGRRERARTVEQFLALCAAAGVPGIVEGVVRPPGDTWASRTRGTTRSWRRPRISEHTGALQGGGARSRPWCRPRPGTLHPDHGDPAVPVGRPVHRSGARPLRAGGGGALCGRGVRIPRGSGDLVGGGDLRQSGGRPADAGGRQAESTAPSRAGAQTVARTGLTRACRLEFQRFPLGLGPRTTDHSARFHRRCKPPMRNWFWPHQMFPGRILASQPVGGSRRWHQPSLLMTPGEMSRRSMAAGVRPLRQCRPFASGRGSWRGR